MPWRSERTGVDGRELLQRLDQAADLRAGQPVVAVAAVRLDGEQAGVGQLAQVAAGGGGADARLGGQPAGRQGATVVEGEQDPAAPGVGDQRPDGGDVGVAGGGLRGRGPLCRGGFHAFHATTGTLRPAPKYRVVTLAGRERGETTVRRPARRKESEAMVLHGIRTQMTRHSETGGPAPAAAPGPGAPARTAAHATAPAPPDAAPARPDPDSGDPHRWAIMAVLGAVAFMAQLDFFIVNVSLDGIGASFPGAGLSRCRGC